MQGRPTPLQAAYAVTANITGDAADVPDEEFCFGFTYPCPSFSTHPEPAQMQTLVNWDKPRKALIISTMIEGAHFRLWDGAEPFFDLLNHELLPYLNEGVVGGLYPWQNAAIPDQYGAIFMFRIVCKKPCPQVVQEIFNQTLYDRAALALWISRTVVNYIAATGHEPTVLERMRLLALEHASFHLHRKDRPETLLPRGFYENLYDRDPLHRN